ncbi:Gamma-aminobutyric acid type B receptor subunit 1 [Holothuria leucospilota]|uniref:Gamma-aminobutyric acid type B receptor subunit 1 n=1 Tax=Holothuria leucospilota TaxID=206669 RepID=A0A9Q1CHI7_HOLLE|nr:Gamma-aminobutyric acid type B receptor subunit 1 [Holothuria leucospilota]
MKLKNFPAFLQTIADLLMQLKQKNITIISSESFDEDPTNQLENLKVSVIRIHKLEMHGKGYIWFLPGWYGKDWYKAVEDGEDCTVDEITQILESSNYIAIQERVLADVETMTVAGIVRSLSIMF